MSVAIAAYASTIKSSVGLTGGRKKYPLDRLPRVHDSSHRLGVSPVMVVSIRSKDKAQPPRRLAEFRMRSADRVH
jgi:hypothetical protein